MGSESAAYDLTFEEVLYLIEKVISHFVFSRWFIVSRGSLRFAFGDRAVFTDK